ncbi:MAG: M48 family metallopeptidase [Planctomycetes bacterium]|nr:M48 family metallopeptidase [Planctomycetota bacterium]
MYGAEEFAGGVFHQSIEGGRATATIELTASGVKAVTSTGQTFEIRYQDCALDVGGASGRMVFLRTMDRRLTIFCEDRRFPKALEMDAGPEFAEQLATVQKSRWREGFQWRMWLAVGTAVCLLCLVGGYYALLWTAKSSIGAIPVSADIQIGKAAFDARTLEGPQVTDRVVVDAVKAMVARLEPHAELKGLTFDVYVVNSSDINAYCLPGGKIVVFTGLLKTAQSAEQVTGVLSHEMSHAIKRHGLRHVMESMGIVVAVELLVGDVGGLVSLAADLGKSAALTSYSRDAETEADVTGVKMLHAAAIDPLELAGFFELLKQQQPEFTAAIQWLSTHPQHDERIATVRGEVAKLPPQEYRGMEIDWEKLQQRLQEIGAE